MKKTLNLILMFLLVGNIGFSQTALNAKAENSISIGNEDMKVLRTTEALIALIPTPTNTSYTGTGNWSDVGNWSDGLPGESTLVTVSAGTLTIDSDVECAELSISTGAIVLIAPGNTLTVSGTLTNNAGTTGLVLQSNASATGMLMNNTPGVQATAQQYLVKDQWHYMGIPISEVIYAGDVFTNCYVAKIPEGSSQTGSDNGWQYLTSEDKLGAMQGCAVQYNSPTSDQDTTLSFSGTLNSGLVDTIFTSGVQGWNFVSNPYPVTIDWSDVDTVFSNATPTTTINMRNMNHAIYLYNPILGSYGTWINWASTNGQTQYIPPMQGFFVQVYNIDAGLSFNDGCKVNEQVTLRSTNVEQQVKLSVYSNEATEKYDEMVVRIKSNSTLNFDRTMDASKLKALASNTPQIYSVLNDEEYSINTIPELTKDLSIPIKIMIKTTGMYSLTLKELKNISGEYPINLFDNSGKLLSNLETEDYQFQATVGETVQLRLGFVTIPTSISELPLMNIKVMTNGNELKVKGLNNIPSELTVTNLNGQILHRAHTTSDEYPITLSQSGIYLIQVITKDGEKFSGKAIINF